MASRVQLKRLEALVWVLIFGGLLAVVYGLMLERYRPQAGWAFVLAGAALAAVGVLLIVLRARLKADDDVPPTS